MTINYVKRFNRAKYRYNRNINNYIEEVNKNKDEAEILNKKLKEEIKKINLLKYTGVRTCINKYIRNMEFLNIKVDKNIQFKEEAIEVLEIKEVKHEKFDSYISFDKKNSFEKIASVIFNFKEIDNKLADINQVNQKTIIRNQVMILDKYHLLESMINKRENIKDLLEKIFEIENEFYKSREDIMYTMMSNCKPGISKEMKLLDNYRNLINKVIKEI